MTLTTRLQTLFAYPFRLFFLLTGLYAVAILIGWLGFLLAGWPLPVGFSPLQWHSHEMLYGFVSAAIAGFLLTAITNWTGCQPLRGGKLALLAGAWLAGRLAFWHLASLPPALVVVADLSFWLFMLVYVVHVLKASNNLRNAPIAGVILLLSIGNALMHWGFITGNTHLLSLGQNWGLDLILLLIAIIGGRIIPAFSRNWLVSHGANGTAVQQNPWLDRAALLIILLLIIAHTAGASSVVISAIALTAAALHSARLYFWRGWRCLREPLLWSLHLGYLWLVISLWLRAASPWLELPASLWQHTLAVGGIGTLILAVMTRVSMGHTGRTMALARGAIWIFIAITAATVVRLLVAVGLLPFTTGLTASAGLWVIAFGLFVLIYVPILTAYRADGRPG
ncbi:NnrS family protein [Gilvimarinus polysaccharolyticus]|uniref:NnrS family protein n=1 Tax=Gilvimarinus polysaccharolyticus TaxID=863921 RepID=UPI00067360B0|nr:NnrS family protein [Gilvimarinus polysaccharolyticus]